MPRRKKKFMLLRGKVSGSLLVVERRWYDFAEIGRRRGRNQIWVIATQSDDEEMLITMANLTDKYVGMAVNHTYEDAEGNITNVRDAASRWELNNNQPSREG